MTLAMMRIIYLIVLYLNLTVGVLSTLVNRSESWMLRRMKTQLLSVIFQSVSTFELHTTFMVIALQKVSAGLGWQSIAGTTFLLVVLWNYVRNHLLLRIRMLLVLQLHGSGMRVRFMRSLLLLMLLMGLRGEYWLRLEYTPA
jgi:hypothetical protein